MDSLREDIRSIIDWTLKHIDMYSKDAAAMVYRTGMAESGYKYLSQMGDGPAIGFFQLADYWKRVYNTELGKGTIEHFLEMNQESL